MNGYNRVKTYFSKPQNIILLLFGIVLTFSTVAPIIAIVKDTITIHPGTIDAHLAGKASGYTLINYVDLFTSRLAKTNLWKPLWNTILLAVFTCTISILYGGTFAFLVTRTNLKFKKYLSSIFISRRSCRVDVSMVVWRTYLQKRSRWYIQRTPCIPYRHLHAEMVVSGIIPELCGSGTSLRAIRLHPDRRNFPEYGRKSGRSGNDPRYTEMEDDVSHYASDGKTGDPLDDPSRIRKRHGKLPGTALSWTYHTFHEVHFLKLQVHR